jgi:hypothetical protein
MVAIPLGVFPLNEAEKRIAAVRLFARQLNLLSPMVRCECGPLGLVALELEFTPGLPTSGISNELTVFSPLLDRVSDSASPSRTPLKNAINKFLIEEFGTELDQVICEASAGKTRSLRSPRVACTARWMKQHRHRNGRVSELYEGLLTLDGVRYSWRAVIAIESGGDRSVGAVELGPIATAPAAA